jgi:hypothetical protein
MKEAVFSRPPERVWSCIESPEAARILTDLTELYYLEPFFGRERTVKEAATALGATIDDVYFRVRRAERLGVLRVIKLEPRAGRAVKRYTSVADGFFVPYRVAPVGGFEALVLGIDLRLERLLIRSLLNANHDESRAANFGLRLFRDHAGEVQIEAAFGPEEPYDFLEPGSPATYSMWPQLNLDFEDAKALQREMDALWKRYAAKSGAQRYLLRLGMTPISGKTVLDDVS